VKPLCILGSGDEADIHLCEDGKPTPVVPSLDYDSIYLCESSARCSGFFLRSSHIWHFRGCAYHTDSRTSNIYPDSFLNALTWPTWNHLPEVLNPGCLGSVLRINRWIGQSSRRSSPWRGSIRSGRSKPTGTSEVGRWYPESPPVDLSHKFTIQFFADSKKSGRIECLRSSREIIGMRSGTVLKGSQFCISL
jgi:hypothetical protein